MDSESNDTFVVEFLAQLASDRAGGRVRPLSEYLGLFPEAEDAVAGAYVHALHQPAASASTSGGDDTDALRVGPYRIEREIGRGGQGVVYLARDDRVGRAVALKVIPRSPLSDELAPRFRREAEVAAAFDHPSLCALYDVGHDENTAWIAFRYIEGETLAQKIEFAGEPLPVADVVRIGEQAARALHIAHQAGVVHRDVKPGNLMITPQGDVVVLDFGVAQRDVEGEVLTLSGDAIGTPYYMAPETFAIGSSGLDRSADIWALGVTLYEAVTLVRPFAAPTREALIQSILTTEPTDPRGKNPLIPRDLVVSLMTAMSKEPDRRYRTAADFAEDLRRIAGHEPILAQPVTLHVRIARFCRRNPALAAALAILVVVLTTGLATTGWLLYRTNRTLAEKDVLLADFTQLSEQKIARDLLAEERTLWPADLERAPDLERWLERSRTLVGNRERYESALRGSGSSQLARTEDPVLDQWLRDQLAQLIADLVRLEIRVPSVAARLEFARTVRTRTLDEPRAAWQRARDEVLADPRFRDEESGSALDLVPQLGLVPLGRDPDSGLQEFAVLATGVPPKRDAESGRLVIVAESAIVLVLLPGGRTRIGVAAPSADRPAGSPRVDPHTEPYEGPIQPVRLDPFFISKYEMTQAQWARHAGDNPASYRTGSSFFPTGEDGALHPVELLSWPTAAETLPQVGLMLPTEAQWEYAARAGTETVWWTGDDVASLAGACNIADAYAQAHGGHSSWEYELTLDDGATVHARIGSFRPNAFGLHDMIGNVAEWCRGTWEDWSEYPPRDGDGFFENPASSAHVLRGGSFSSGALLARIERRDAYPAAISPFNAGIRPARALDRPSRVDRQGE